MKRALVSIILHDITAMKQFSLNKLITFLNDGHITYLTMCHIF